jgi:hypothetical protein
VLEFERLAEFVPGDLGLILKQLFLLLIDGGATQTPIGTNFKPFRTFQFGSLTFLVCEPLISTKILTISATTV